MGSPDGLPLGSPDGSPLGSPDGLHLGSPDGLPLGSPNGLPLGSPDDPFVRQRVVRYRHDSHAKVIITVCCPLRYQDY